MLVMADFSFDNFFFSSRRRHTRCELVNGVQTCALPISARLGPATPGLVAAGWWLLAQRKAASPPQTPPLKRRGLQRPPPVVSCPSIPRAEQRLADAHMRRAQHHRGPYFAAHPQRPHRHALELEESRDGTSGGRVC